MRTRTLAALAWLAAPALALAHPGHGATSTGLAAGFLHPFTGADHLAAMVSVGLWSALTLRRRRWLAPLAFAAMVLAGALGGARATTHVEPLIAASLLALGLLVAARVELPAAVGALLAGGFAFVHGAAHGNELQGGGALLGMVLATVLLHAAGLGAGIVLRDRQRWLAAAIGAGVALLGALGLTT